MFYGVVGASFLSLSAHAGDNALLFSPTSIANTMPAVDGVNGKVEAFGGSIANRNLVASQGALSVPLTGPLGAQIDGALGNFDGRNFGNIAGHVFWRNPGEGLIGIYTSHTFWDRYNGVYVGQVAGEAERYVGRWTVQGIAGVEFGKSASYATAASATIAPGADNFPFGGTPGVATSNSFADAYTIKTRFFDQINIKYYFTDDWNGYVGHRYLGGKNALALGSEVGLPLGRHVEAAAFAEARVGEGSFHGIWGGVKFYFGQGDKPLIKRHRQDDPNIWSTDTLFSITNSHTTSGSNSSTQFCGPGGTLGGGSCEYTGL
jgi:hypothetical protein